MGLLDRLFRSKKRILVAEDEANVRGLILDILAGEGYEVQPALDGIEALNLCKKGRFDLLILDVHMPRMEGTDVLANVRALPGGQDQRVMMLTSEGLTATVNKAVELNAEYMLKPFKVQDLVERVRSLLPPK